MCLQEALRWTWCGHVQAISSSVTSSMEMGEWCSPCFVCLKCTYNIIEIEKAKVSTIVSSSFHG